MTRYVKQRYSYFMDLSTETDSMQIIKVTAGGRMPQIRLHPFFGAFKYFKLGKIRLRFVPAATLPVDPTGLSYEAGSQTVDPRDQFNPGLVRITNGEDISPFADYYDTTDGEMLYYSTMLDDRWYKFQLQKGFQRTAVPLYWTLGTPAQTVHPDFNQVNFMENIDERLQYGSDDLAGFGSVGIGRDSDNGSDPYLYANDINFEGHYMIQGERRRVGWMPTDMFQAGIGYPNVVPEIEVITIVLPKAYKTRYFYRVYIEEEVMFRDPVVINPMAYNILGDATGGKQPDWWSGGSMPIDRGIRVGPNQQFSSSVQTNIPTNASGNTAPGARTIVGSPV